MKYLAKYNAIAQHYGEWLRGYRWSIYGCGTFRMTLTATHAKALGKRFFERLERRLRLDVSYAGIVEHRYSGCGFSPIRVHWHFLAASPAQPGAMAHGAKELWQRLYGIAKIDPYDPSGFGAYYLTKLAAHPNGSLVTGKIDRLKYQGSMDLLAAAEANPYVPDHLKDRVFGEYLVIRDSPQISLQQPSLD